MLGTRLTFKAYSFTHSSHTISVSLTNYSVHYSFLLILLALLVHTFELFSNYCVIHNILCLFRWLKCLVKFLLFVGHLHATVLGSFRFHEFPAQHAPKFSHGLSQPRRNFASRSEQAEKHREKRKINIEAVAESKRLYFQCLRTILCTRTTQQGRTHNVPQIRNVLFWKHLRCCCLENSLSRPLTLSLSFSRSLTLPLSQSLSRCAYCALYCACPALS